MFVSSYFLRRVRVMAYGDRSKRITILYKMMGNPVPMISVDVLSLANLVVAGDGRHPIDIPPNLFGRGVGHVCQRWRVICSAHSFF